MRCKVITSNEFVAVVNYGGKQIQIPGSLITNNEDEVEIVVENGIAKLVEPEPKEEIKSKRKRAKKAE